MNNDDINFISSIANTYDPYSIIINLICSFILGLLISYIYRITHKGISYSQSFMLTIVFVAIIVAMVMMVIGNNIARAFALVGALSIIRFRTVIKDTKDIVYIFWSLAAGMACGTGSYFLALVSAVLITIIAYILFKTNYGSIYKSEFILQFRYNKLDETESEASYLKKLSEFCSTHNLLNSEPSSDKKSLKLTYDIVLKEDMDSNKFVLEISNCTGVNEASIVAAQNDIDY